MLLAYIRKKNVLTINAQRYPLANRGWYTIAGYAEVNAGLSPVKPQKFQVIAGERVVCKQNNDNDYNDDDNN